MKRQEPRTVMLYGESGIGKTAEIYQLCIYLLKKWKKEGKKKKIRVLNSDGGGSMVYFEERGLVKAGLVEGLDISASKIIHLECKAIGEGRWPDENGYKGADTDWFEPDLDWIQENIGAYVIEGFDSMAKRWRGHMSRKEESAGFKHSFKYQEDSPKLGLFSAGGLQEGHYGMIQTEMEIWWNTQLRMLPVEFVIASSLVAKGKDKKKNSIYGPSTVGQAQAHDIPQWFNDCWHLELIKAEMEGTVQDLRVAWLKEHTDTDTDCQYLAKVRTLPDLLGKQEEKFPNGFIVLKPGMSGITDYYKWKEEVIKV